MWHVGDGGLREPSVLREVLVVLQEYRGVAAIIALADQTMIGVFARNEKILIPYSGERYGMERIF